MICLEPGLSLVVGNKIKEYREYRKMTQLALAAKMHVDAFTISRHEHVKSLSLDDLPNYAESLGVSVQVLIQTEGPVYEVSDAGQRRLNEVMDSVQASYKLSNEKLDMLLSLMERMLEEQIN